MPQSREYGTWAMNEYLKEKCGNKGSGQTQAELRNTTHRQQVHPGHGAPGWNAAIAITKWNVEKHHTTKMYPVQKIPPTANKCV